MFSRATGASPGWCWVCAQFMEVLSVSLRSAGDDDVRYLVAAGSTTDNVRFGSKADVKPNTHLRPLSGVKRTSNVRFQRPATDPAGAEDVTDMLGKRHGYVGHGFVGALVVFGWEVSGWHESQFPLVVYTMELNTERPRRMRSSIR